MVQELKIPSLIIPSCETKEEEHTRVSMEVIVTIVSKLGEISPTYPGRIRNTYLYYGVKCQSIDPKYNAFRRWLDTLIIIWEYDWIPRAWKSPGVGKPLFFFGGWEKNSPKNPYLPLRFSPFSTPPKLQQDGALQQVRENGVFHGSPHKNPPTPIAIAENQRCFFTCFFFW